MEFINSRNHEVEKSQATEKKINKTEASSLKSLINLTISCQDWSKKKKKEGGKKRKKKRKSGKKKREHLKRNEWLLLTVKY